MIRADYRINDALEVIRPPDEPMSHFLLIKIRKDPL